MGWGEVVSTYNLCPWDFNYFTPNSQYAAEMYFRLKTKNGVPLKVVMNTNIP